MSNQLVYGDNLEALRSMPSESIDLVYLDPPFNSNRDYSVLFATRDGTASKAQAKAFDDTWSWTIEAAEQYEMLLAGGFSTGVADVIEGLRRVLGASDAMAYLVMMTPRLVELRRVMKSTASLYLHCDPTASHYLKIILDAVFGPMNFRSEVVWKRTHSHNSAKRWGPIHDVILFYSKSQNFVWNPQYQAYSEEYLRDSFTFEDERGLFQPITLTGPGIREGDSGQPWRGIDPTGVGRHWQPSKMFYELYEKLTGESLAAYPMADRLDRADAQGLIWWPKKVGGVPRFKQYAHLSPGLPLQDVITDITRLSNNSAERLGYPTQKPIALLERIIAASSNPGDTVLDPFCGCGTTVDAAEGLGRKWVGIDITFLAIDLIANRLKDRYGDGLKPMVVSGIPRDLPGAEALFAENPLDFERWAVSLVGGTPNEKQVGDSGVDGVIRFRLTESAVGRVVVSVKGGQSINPAMVRDLVGTVENSGAEMGILILMKNATAGMVKAAAEAGGFVWEYNAVKFPRVQVITVGELLGGEQPKLPPRYLAYVKAEPRRELGEHPSLPI